VSFFDHHTVIYGAEIPSLNIFMGAQDFYNQHSHHKHPQIPLLDTGDVVQTARAAIKEDLGWIQLDRQIDVPAWHSEAYSLIDRFVTHREGDGKGWKSLCIHGLGPEKTGTWNNYYDSEEGLVYDWTEVSRMTPTIKSFWEQFPFERYYRIRFMLLEPHGYVSPHTDAPITFDHSTINPIDYIIPINVAIDHPDNCNMAIENKGCLPWKTGRMILPNITKYHAVVNNSDRPRMHLIAHGIVGNREKGFSELLVRSIKKQNEQYQNI
jgi:hypothetical protein